MTSSKQCLINCDILINPCPKLNYEVFSVTKAFVNLYTPYTTYANLFREYFYVSDLSSYWIKYSLSLNISQPQGLKAEGDERNIHKCT